MLALGKISKKLRNVVFVLVLLALGVGAVLGKIQADTTPTDSVQPALPEVSQYNQDVSAANPNLGQFANKNFRDTSTAFLCMLTEQASGCDPKGRPVTADSGTGTKQADYGIYGNLIGMIGGMYKEKPAGTEQYMASLMQDMRLTVAQPAYAQGLGFSALDPILTVWKTFRGIAYMGFIVIFLVIGFMIMFRQRIGGQAVVTVQQAIPNIVIALIAVTFSYAIAGLLIDAMYLVMYFLAGMFNQTNLINGNVFQMAWNILIVKGAGQSGAEAVGNFVNDTLGGGIGGHIAAVIANVTAAIVIWIVIIFNTFKLFISLLQVYVDIILNIAFAPITLMMGAIPGQNVFGKWLRNLIADLAVFPGILLLLIIFTILQNNIGGGGGFNPPYIGGAGSAGYLPFLAGLALILALPQAVDEIKKALGGNQGGIFGTLIQAGLKNANDQRKRAFGIEKGAAVAVGGGLLGAAAGNYYSRVNENQRGHMLRNTLIGAGLGTTAPIAIPVAKKGIGAAVQLGKSLEGFAAAGRGLGEVYPELPGMISDLTKKGRTIPVLRTFMPPAAAPAHTTTAPGHATGGATGPTGTTTAAPTPKRGGPVTPPTNVQF